MKIETKYEIKDRVVFYQQDGTHDIKIEGEITSIMIEYFPLYTSIKYKIKRYSSSVEECNILGKVE